MVNPTVKYVLLLLAEIGLWLYLALLLSDAVLNPPQRWLVRVVDQSVRPRVVLSEHPRSDFSRPRPLRWLEAEPTWGWPRRVTLDAWREQEGTARGPLNGYSIIVSQPSVPWAIARILTTMAVGGLVITLLRVLRARVPRKAHGFEVHLAQGQTTRGDQV